MFFSTPTETPADPRLRGCFVKPNIELDGISKNASLFSLRSFIVGTGQSQQDRSSVNQIPNGETIAIKVKEANVKRLIPFRVKLKQSQISGTSFFVVIDAMDENGIIGQTLVMNINHEQNIDNFNAPSSDISSKVSYAFDSLDKKAKITIRKNDPNISACVVYVRELSEMVNPLHSKFKQRAEIDFEFSGKSLNSWSQKSSFTLPLSDNKISIIRVVPKSKNGKVFGNFSSSTVSIAPLASYRASIYTQILSAGVKVMLMKYSPNIIGAYFERKDLTANEKKFKRIISPIDIDQNDTSFVRNMISVSTMRNGPLQVIDTGVVDGHAYEYRAKLFMKEGVERISKISRVQKFTRKMNLVTSQMQNLTTTPRSTSSGTPTGSESQDFRNVVISFIITFELASTSLSKIKVALDAVGLSELYSKDMSIVRSNLNNLVFFEVERFNVFTGKTYYLGNIWTR